MSEEHTGQQITGDEGMDSQDSDQSRMKSELNNQKRTEEQVEVGEEAQEPNCSNQDGAEAPPDRMQVDVNQEDQQGVPQNQQGALKNQQGALKNQQGALKNQQGVLVNQQGVLKNQQGALQELLEQMSKCLKCRPDERLLVDCISETSSDPKNLLQVFRFLNEHQKKSHKGEGSSVDDSEAGQQNTAGNSSSSSSSSSSSWFSWSKAPVKVFSVVTGETYGADRVIRDKVKKSVTMELTAHSQECDIIIVFCPIISRVGSDVAAAMRRITDNNKPVILVLMHHTRDADYSTDIKKWSDHFKNVVLDVHVLYHETLQGLLKCRTNDQSVLQIQKVLKQHSKTC